LKGENRLDLIAEPENRLAFLDSSMFVNNVFKDFKIGMPSIFESDEVIAKVLIAASISPPLKDIVSLKTSQLIESGIFKRIFERYSKRGFPVKPQAIGPEVLTIQHLSAGFVVICGLLVLCILAFAAEWLTVLMKHRFKHRKFQVIHGRFKLIKRSKKFKTKSRKWALPKCTVYSNMFTIILRSAKRF
jgi:hypothetical protein